MRILVIGDVIGRPGRRAITALLPRLRFEFEPNLIIANGENLSGGFGITLEKAEELFREGVDVITTGNHVWDQKEIIPHLDGEAPILRPFNYPPGVPGKGFLVHKGVLVVNLMGRVFMNQLDCPFRAMDQLLDRLPERPRTILVDFHAEATSEKGAMGWYLDGRVSAVVGTHTHVPTADAKILPKGTAFVSDIGMVGPRDSIIGDRPEDVLERFLTQTPNRLNVASGPVMFNSVLIDVGEDGKAVSILRIDRLVEP